MPQNLLKGIHVPAVLQIPGGEGMPEQMGTKPGNAGTSFQLAEHLSNRAEGEGLSVPVQKDRPMMDTGGTPGKIPGKHFPGVQAEGDNALFVSLACDDGIPFGQMKAVQREESGFMHTQTAVQHEGAQAQISQLQGGTDGEAGHEPPYLIIGENVDQLTTGLWKPEPLGEVDRMVFLHVQPRQKRTDTPDISLHCDGGSLAVRKPQSIFLKARKGKNRHILIRAQKGRKTAQCVPVVSEGMRRVTPYLLIDQKGINGLLDGHSQNLPLAFWHVLS